METSSEFLSVLLSSEWSDVMNWKKKKKKAENCSFSLFLKEEKLVYVLQTKILADDRALA